MSTWKLGTFNITLSDVPVKMSIEFCMDDDDDEYDDDNDDYDGISNTIGTMEGGPIEYDDGDGDDNGDDEDYDDDDDY